MAAQNEAMKATRNRQGKPKYKTAARGWYITVKGRDVFLSTGGPGDKWKAQAALERLKNQPNSPIPAVPSGPPTSLGEIIEKWVAAKGTARALHASGAWWQYTGGVSPDQLTPRSLTLFAEHLISSGWTRPGEKRVRKYTASYVRTCVATAKAIWNWAHEQGWIGCLPKPARPFGGRLPKPTLDYRDVPAEILRKAFERLERGYQYEKTWTCPKCRGEIIRNGAAVYQHKKHCDGKGYQPQRSREQRRNWKSSRRRHPAYGILRFILETGCRPSEGCHLQWDQVRLDLAACLLRQHKTVGEGKSRTIYLTPAAQEILEAIPNRTGYVFRNREGKPYTPAGLRSILRKLGIKGAYSLRHSRAQTMREQGFQLDEVAAQLGHASVRTTQIYAQVRSDQARQVARCVRSPLEPVAEPRLASELPDEGTAASKRKPSQGGSDIRLVG